MAFQGTFKDFALPDILQLIGLQRKTGILTVESPQDTASIYFQEGAIVWFRSRRAPLEARMRRVLCLRGLVTEAQMAEADRLRAEARLPLGDVLRRHFALAEEDWRDAVDLEVTEALYRIFRWREGTYRFEVRETLDAVEARITPLTVDGLLMEGIRRVDEWALIEQHLPSLEGVPFRMTAEDPPDTAGLEPNEARILGLVDGRTRVADLVDSSGLGEFEAAKALASLLAGGRVDLRPELPPPPAAPAPPPARRAAGPWVRWALVGGWVALNLVVFRPWRTFIPAAGEADLPRQVRARADRAALALHLDQYRAEAGAYPATLEALVRRGMVEQRLLRDPWGRPYRYEVRGDRYLLGDEATAVPVEGDGGPRGAAGR